MHEQLVRGGAPLRPVTDGLQRHAISACPPDRILSDSPNPDLFGLFVPDRRCQPVFRCCAGQPLFRTACRLECLPESAGHGDGKAKRRGGRRQLGSARQWRGRPRRRAGASAEAEPQLVEQTRVRQSLDDYGRITLRLIHDGERSGEWGVDPDPYQLGHLDGVSGRRRSLPYFEN
jgi:hypothetical protein